VETTSATALPGETSVPAAGFELMTLPEGTVALLAWVIAPTVNPAPVIAADAAACVEFTTIGTATCAGPVEMTNATALPTATSVPAAGFELMTQYESGAQASEPQGYAHRIPSNEAQSWTLRT
jgi:hypothetical protein